MRTMCGCVCWEIRPQLARGLGSRAKKVFRLPFRDYQHGSIQLRRCLALRPRVIHIARSRPRSIAQRTREPVKEPDGSVTDLGQVVGGVWPLVQKLRAWASLACRSACSCCVCVSEWWW